MLNENQLKLLRHLSRFNLLDYPSCLDMLNNDGGIDRTALSYAFRPLTKNRYVSKDKRGCVSILAKGRALFPELEPLLSAGGGEQTRQRIMEVSRMAALMERSSTVVPADPNKICKPDIVAAHTLYERTSPFTTEFPGGGLDMSGSSFSAEPDGRTVRVRGTKFVEPARLTLKLEGSRHTGFRCICLAGIRDPFVIANFAEIEKRLRTKVKRDLPQFEEDKDYKILFHRYGAGEIMKERDPETWTPKEIGLVIEVISPDQDTANTVCALCRSGILHQGFPGRRANSGNLAFLYTPAEFPAPPCYEFALYHLMVVDDLIKPFPITWVQK